MFPGAHPGAGILYRPHLRQVADLVFPLVGQVAPVQADHPLGNLRVGFGMPPHDVPPEHGGDALGQKPPAQLRHMRHIQRVLALLLGQGAAAVLAQVKGLITADVELVAGEQRPVFANQPLDEIHGPGMGDIQGMMLPRVGVAEGNLFRIPQLAQLRAGLGGQDLIHVPEAGQGGHQLNVPGPAVGVQLHDFLGREGRILPPGLAEVAEKIGVFHIELPLIDLVAAQQVRGLFQGSQGGYPAPGAIQVIAAIGHVRRVLHLQGRERGAMALYPLPQGHDAGSDDKYNFRDATGTIVVEIDHEVFAGRTVTPSDVTESR